MAHSGQGANQLSDPSQPERPATTLEQTLNRLGTLNDRAETLEMRLNAQRDKLMGAEPPMERGLDAKTPQEVRPHIHQLCYLVEKLESTIERSISTHDQIAQTL